MSQPPRILDYAPKTPERSPFTRFLPWWFIVAAMFITILTKMQPLDVGSGRFILNPLRFAGCAFAVIAMFAFAMLRLRQDRTASTAKRTVFSLCLLTAVAAFVAAEASVWGEARLPPLDLRFPYWRWLTVMAGAIAATCMFSVVSGTIRLSRSVAARCRQHDCA